jgi:murein DD-endopeptidase MepM/ murein hydrolase activator NlpD
MRGMSGGWLRAVCVGLALACAGSGLASGTSDKPPWRARKRPDTTHNQLAAERVKPEDWEPEPESPATLDQDRFTRALALLCNDPTPARARERAELIVEHAKAQALDPFLLGALVYRTSRCRSDKEELGGHGLTLLPAAMYQSGFRGRSYQYFVREGSGWAERKLELPRFMFGPGTLLRADSNLYFAAALLALWRDQHATIDATFEQAPHRHFISHFIWGDRVKSSRAEDRVLGDRRRMLEYYGALPPRAPIPYRGLMLGAPLDGAPRVVSSGLGFVREDGARSHRGVDLESEFGEPVRAIEAGLVTFSGVDLPGQRNHEQLTVTQTNAFDRSVLGHGGRYVCVQHAPSDGKFLRSCYMHLETVEVAYGARVTRGQKLGTVGRTGMQTSSPHLHLELLGPEGLFDGAELLRGHVIGTPVELEPPKKRKR